MVEGRTHKPVIRSEKCHTCEVCLRGCAAQLVPEYRTEETSLRGVLYREKLQGGFTNEKAPLPPCQNACPIHQDTRGYVALVAKEKVKEALELIREVNPLPAVCGFICHHPCEEACLREGVDQPVPIRLLKRFVGEYERAGDGHARRVRKERREKILVVGSGPAGLTAANDLRLLGYKVTIIEALPVLGGMLAVGIPEFRLPRDILNMEIDGIRRLGVEMKTQHRFEFDGSSKGIKKLGYQAVFLSIGAHRSERLNIPGEKLRGVIPGLEFLRNLNLGKEPRIGKEVVVIGRGNTALDVARSAVRLGAESVEIYYRKTRQEMPTISEEMDEAMKEGISLRFLSAPVRILGRGEKVTGMECVEMQSVGPNEAAESEPIPVKGSNFKVKADTIIAAVGQRIDTKCLKGLAMRPDGTLQVEPETGATSMKGVYAGGDIVTGPGWAIDAIAAGKKAAAAIHRALS